MRRLILFNMITADGYFEGLNDDISWHRVDEEVNDFIIEQMKSADTILFGRKTYQMMEAFWPLKEAFDLDPITAGMMQEYSKIVFSTALEKIKWKKTKQVSGNAVKEIKNLKAQPGKDILIFGSADLCEDLIRHTLIDEFRLMINPVVLGNGKPFFKKEKIDLRLLKAKIFGNGNVLLYYRSEERTK